MVPTIRSTSKEEGKTQKLKMYQFRLLEKGILQTENIVLW